jgi:hypothetical protein
MRVGETKQFTATILDLHDATLTTAVWSRSNAAVASISLTTGPTTTATGLRNGTTYIKATANGVAYLLSSGLHDQHTFGL